MPDARGTFVLALGLVTALAVLDLVLGEEAVLVELLAAGRSSRRQAQARSARRSWPATPCVLSVPLGLVGDAFGSVQHVVGILVVGIVGALAVALSGHRARREELLERERGAREDATRTRDELQAMLSGIADAVTGQAPDGSLIYANDAALTTLGFESRDEFLNTPPGEILARFDLYEESGAPFPPEQLPGRRALTGEGVAEAIIRFRVRATGEERWSVVKSTPVHDNDGFLRMAINVIEDITAHKRSELAERFLSESSRLLASSLDPDEVLERVAELAVPEVADWCAVDVLRVDGELERVALAHTDHDDARERARGQPPLPAARRSAERSGTRDPHRALRVRGGGAHRADTPCR